MARKNLKIPSSVSEKLYRRYITLADRADKRMERLEKLSQTNEIYHGVTAYAYRKATEAISYWDNVSEAYSSEWLGVKIPDMSYDTLKKRKYKKPRFARNNPNTDKELRAKIKDIEAFLEMPTSTKKGIDETYKNRAEGLNNTFGTNFTWQEWARFGARDYWSGKDGIGYRELIAVASREKAKEEIEKKIKTLAKSFKPSKKGNSIKAIRNLKRSIKKDYKNLVSDMVDDFSGNILGDDAIDYKDLLSKDIEMIQKSVNTIFEEDNSIVMKQARKYMAMNGLTYKDMFT